MVPAMRRQGRLGRSIQLFRAKELNVTIPQLMTLLLPGAEWKPEHSKEGEAGVALQAEGEHPAFPGGGRSQFAEASEAVLGAGVSPL